RHTPLRKPLRKTFLPGSFLSRGVSRLVKMPYSSGFVASTTCGDGGYEPVMKTTAGSCTTTLSMTGAMLRLRNATLTVSTEVVVDGLGMVSFHCTYRAGGTLMAPVAPDIGTLQALQVASGVRVFPERKAMARCPLSRSSPSMRKLPNLEKRSTSFAAERNSARDDGAPSIR